MATKHTSRRGKLTNFPMPYHFNEAEMLQLGQDLPAQLKEVREKQAQAKKVAKAWKDEIEMAQGTAFQTERKLETGMEMRPVSARMVINFTEGVREYYAVDGDDLLGTEPMMPGDEQLTLNDLED
jgi:hypothetical protein